MIKISYNLDSKGAGPSSRTQQQPVSCPTASYKREFPNQQSLRRSIDSNVNMFFRRLLCEILETIYIFE